MKTTADIAIELAPTLPDEDEKNRWRKAQKNEAGTLRWMGILVATIRNDEVQRNEEGCKEAKICMTEATARVNVRISQ